MWCSVAHLPLPPILPQSSLRKNTPKIQTSCSPSERRRQIPQNTDASAQSSGRGGRRKRSPSSSPTWRRSSMSRNHCVRWTTYNCRRHSPTLAAVLKSRPIALPSSVFQVSVLAARCDTPSRTDKSIEIEDVQVQACQCTPLSVRLVQGGVFGCAPIAPSLAVDMRVLEFARNLFLHIAPNNTAFCATLEGVLAAMGFQLEHQASRFFSWPNPY